MARKKLDPFDRRIPRPRSLDVARFAGETLVLGLYRVSGTKLGRAISEEDLLKSAKIGQSIGEKMHREKARWSVNGFLGYLYQMANQNPA